jgi:hypothetical protein
MDEHEVRKVLGAPDEIIGRKDRMRSRVWQCSSCLAVTHSEQPIHVPAPCVQCGGIAFRVIRDGGVLPEV